MAVFNRGVMKDMPAYSLRGQVPVPQKSVVSFVDILGYSAKVADAAESGKSNEFLFDFRQALFAASEYLEADAPCYAFNFTDSVVVGWPIIEENDSEVPLCISCWNLATYQLSMTQYGFFVRGGVAVGEAYFDEYVQSGEAFLKAYDTEKQRSIYPRIVLSEDAVAEARVSCSYHASDSCPLDRLFAVDADGEVFVNYLSCVFDIFDLETSRQDILEYIDDHREMIEKNLLASESNLKVYRKYQWAARYHDFFCDEISDLLEDDLSITVSYGKERLASPRRLLEVFPDWAR